MADALVRAVAKIIETTCYEQGGEIQAAEDAAEQIVSLLDRELSDDPSAWTIQYDNEKDH